MSGNFLPLSFLDPFELIASLPKRMGLFQAGEPRMLPIRTSKATSDPGDAAAYRTGDLAKWPEMKAILGQIERAGEQQGGVEFGHIRMDLLTAGKCLPWELSDTPYLARFNRLVMALRTNPGVMHYSGVEAMHLVPGWVVWVNQRTWRSTVNMGETSAIHLIIDTRRKEP